MGRAVSDRAGRGGRLAGVGSAAKPGAGHSGAAPAGHAGRSNTGSAGNGDALGGAVDGAARTGVRQIQRARILAALVEVARERGAGRVTVAHVVARSGVSRRTFYEFFEDREACFIAAFREAVQRAAVSVVPAFQGSERWRDRIRAGLRALLEFLDEEPQLGGLCIVDALGGGPRALESRTQVLQTLIDAVDQGRGETRAGLIPTRLTAEGIVGGVLAVLYARLIEHQSVAAAANAAHPGPRGSFASAATKRAARAPAQPKPLVGLLAPLSAMIVLPYQGSAAARREEARPAPRARRRARPPRSNPLEGLEMRLTYRTVRVLAAIAANPDISNRQVADAAGIADQGQISKLLTRLEHLGLIDNVGVGQAHGEPNAWQLTAKGHDVEQTIRQQGSATTS